MHNNMEVKKWEGVCLKEACFRELTVLTKYMSSVRESSHTLSLTAAVAIHTLHYFSWKHAHPLSMFCVSFIITII